MSDRIEKQTAFGAVNDGIVEDDKDAVDIIRTSMVLACTQPSSLSFLVQASIMFPSRVPKGIVFVL